MGLYVPNVRLPGDGDFELWIAVKKDGSFTYNVSGGWRDGKQKVVSVPAHGRMIDASSIWYLLYDYVDAIGVPDMMCFDKIMEAAFSSVPTIIEAEEE